jgi:hypothetical protein
MSRHVQIRQHVGAFEESSRVFLPKTNMPGTRYYLPPRPHCAYYSRICEASGGAALVRDSHVNRWAERVYVRSHGEAWSGKCGWRSAQEQRG